MMMSYVKCQFLKCSNRKNGNLDPESDHKFCSSSLLLLYSADPWTTNRYLEYIDKQLLIKLMSRVEINARVPFVLGRVEMESSCRRLIQEWKKSCWFQMMSAEWNYWEFFFPLIFLPDANSSWLHLESSWWCLESCELKLDTFRYCNPYITIKRHLTSN